MKTRSLIFAVLAGFIFAFSSCERNDQDQTGTLLMKITDAPFPINLIEEANVTITKVEVRNESDTAGNPFMVLLEDTLDFNLLELRNGVAAELLETEIPVGEYSLIRLYVDNASISVKDHETYAVKVPSGAQTGIKIFIEPSLKVAGGLTSEVLLDFNVEKSFVLKGDMNTPAGIKGFNFKPVIRAVNNTISGMVEGIVMDPDSVVIAEASVWIAQDTTITSAFSSDEGFFALPGIPAGSYSLSAVKEGYDTVTVNDIIVIEGNITEHDLILEPTVE